MEAELISHMGTDLSAVNAARVSMDKESGWEFYRIDELKDWDGIGKNMEFRLKKEDAKLIDYLAKHKHFSCFEHQAVTLRLKVPLFVRSQIHRHRTFSYNEISRRYVTSNLEFYWPDTWRAAAASVKQGSSQEEAEGAPKEGHLDDVAHILVDSVEQHYIAMIKAGVCAEQARMILPQNLYTQFYMTGNLRNWCHFLKLRLDPHAQKEVRDVAQQCADLIAPLFPVSYEALMSND